MASNISTSFTADVAPLRAGADEATAAVRGFASEAARANSSLDSASSAARSASSAFTGASQSAASMGQAIMAIGQEAASGNFANLPSQIAAARDSMVSASAAAVGLGAALGAAALGAARLVEYLYRVRDAREAVNAARVSFTPGIGEAEAESLRKQFVEMEGISTELSGRLTASFMRIQGVGVDTMRFLAAAAKPVSAAMGIDFPAAAADMAAAMDQPTAKGQEFLERIRASQAQLDRFHAAIGNNSPLEARAVILERLNQIVKQQTEVTGTAAARAEQLRAANLAAARATSMGPNDTSMTSVVQQLERAAPATDRYAAAVAALTNQERQAAGPSWIDAHETKLASLELAIKQQARAEGATREQARQRELTATVKFWNDVLTGEQLNAKQREDVTRRLLRAKEALEDAQFKPAARSTNTNRAAQEEIAAMQAELRSRAQLTNEALAERKAALDEEVASERMTRAEALGIYAEYVTAQRNLQLAAMSDVLSQIPAENRVAQQIANDKLAIEARLQRELQQLRAQEAREVQQMAQRQVQAYTQSFSGVEGVFKSAATGMLMGTTTWAQATKSVLGSVAGGFIDLAATEVSRWGAMELAKTTISGGAALRRVEIEQLSGRSGWGALLAEWFGLEAGKTGATAAGAAARTSISAGAALAGKAIEKGAAMSVIGTDAAVAAANVYRTVSAIPVVGPVLAPLAAGAAFAAVMAFGNMMPSFDRGTMNVPQNMTAQIHKGEMIVPANLASAWRSGQAARGFNPGALGGGGGVTVHLSPIIQTIDSASFVGKMKQHGRALAGIIKHELAHNPTMRPAY